MLLRPGNAGSNIFADHLAVLTAALRQIPARMRSRLLARVDGAGPSATRSPVDNAHSPVRYAGSDGGPADRDHP